ncbi:exosome complex exonuclease Rrp41 [Candidatus Woesearchaeota archaeon]|nr:exosome complex exonuclease Rrp41 [Candidatus Woesearchaeota archaeon]
MTYAKRYDGRKWTETRPITAETGVVKMADGSARFKIGKTEAIAAVYGPRDLHPRFMQDPEKGVLRIFYSMMPFSGAGDRVRPGPSRRSKELNLVIQKALLPVLNLDDFPNKVVDVFVVFPQTDAGSRCAGICAASMALADAGMQMKDVVSAVSVGKVDDKLVVDMDYAEEAHPEGEVADIPVAVIPSTGEITLIQMDGKITKEELIKGVKDGWSAFDTIADIQRKAIAGRYGGKEE